MSSATATETNAESRWHHSVQYAPIAEPSAASDARRPSRIVVAVSGGTPWPDLGAMASSVAPRTARMGKERTDA